LYVHPGVALLGFFTAPGVFVDTRGFFPAVVLRAAFVAKPEIGGLPLVPLREVPLVRAVVLAKKFQYRNKSRGRVVPLTVVGGDVVAARKAFSWRK